jgi:hypothetical protein
MTRPIIYMLLTFCPLARGATTQSHGKEFPTAMAAAQALVNAAKTENTAELVAILGPSSKDLVATKDPVDDRLVRRQFVERASESLKVVPNRNRPHEMTVIAGRDGWSLPIPIVQSNGMWYLDMARGKKQILTRRIGGNELDAIEVCRGYVEAQDQFAEEHKTPEGVHYYAQKMISTPGERDGLYWPEAEGEESPMGPIIAHAIAEGYTNKNEPYRGYYFRILTGEHSGASKTPVSYLDNGVMSKGFALIAWPAQYGSTGIMTFLVNKSGIVYQKDLGPNTSKLASQLDRYEASPTWVPVSAGVAILNRR